MVQQEMTLRTGRLSRDDRLAQLLAVLARAGRALPASDIFRLMHLKRTPYSVGILAQLVSEGYVKYRVEELANGWPVRMYSLTRDGVDITSPPWEQA
jgi:hypothetical protein